MKLPLSPVADALVSTIEPEATLPLVPVTVSVPVSADVVPEMLPDRLDLLTIPVTDRETAPPVTVPDAVAVIWIASPWLQAFAVPAPDRVPVKLPPAPASELSAGWTTSVTSLVNVPVTVPPEGQVSGNVPEKDPVKVCCANNEPAAAVRKNTTEVKRSMDRLSIALNPGTRRLIS